YHRFSQPVRLSGQTLFLFRCASVTVLVFAEAVFSLMTINTLFTTLFPHAAHTFASFLFHCIQLFQLLVGYNSVKFPAGFSFHRLVLLAEFLMQYPALFKLFFHYRLKCR